MEKNNIIATWLKWHFFEVPVFLLDVWGNFLWASLNFFSAPLLVKTFFSPWRRYWSKYPSAFAPAEWASTLITNVFSRIIGAFCRFFLIIAGIISFIIVLIIGGAVVIAWIFLPLVMLMLIIFLIHG